MTTAKLRLALAAALFAAWVGWLIFLALTTRQEFVLSRPQFLAADLYVVAELKADGAGKPSSEAEIKEVLWSRYPVEKAFAFFVALSLPREECEHLLASRRSERAMTRTSPEITPIPRSTGRAASTGEGGWPLGGVDVQDRTATEMQAAKSGRQPLPR